MSATNKKKKADAEVSFAPPDTVAATTTNRNMPALLLGWGMMLAAPVGGWFLCEELIRRHVLAHAIVGINNTCGGPALDCNSVALSSFSEIAGVSLPVFGLTFFTALGVLPILVLLSAVLRKPTTTTAAAAVAAGRDADAFAARHVLVLGWSVGMLASLALFTISLVAIGSLCPYCLGVYGCCLGGLIGAWLAARSGPLGAMRAVLRSPAKALAHPAAISLLVAVIAAISVYIPLAEITKNELLSTEQRMQMYLAQKLEGTILDAPDLIPPDAPTMGPESAPVTIVIFVDYTCPHCAAAAEFLTKIQQERYPTRVRLVWRSMFGEGRRDMAEYAARAAICAENQGKFDELRRKMVYSQIAMVNDNLDVRRNVVVHAGLDMERFDRELNSAETTAKLQRDLDFAKRIHLTETPTFFINGRWHVGAREGPVLLGLVERELALAH
ncbi:MAG: thioredoxin domain-containing protein [Planctomycetota bacterium]